MKIVRLHVGLIKYLIKELPKRKKLNDLIKFIRLVFKSYFKELLKIYKELFIQLNPQYQKQKRDFKKYQQYKKDISNAYKIIQWMIKQGENRTERKHIRKDFEKHGRLSKETEKTILRDIYGVK